MKILTRIMLVCLIAVAQMACGKKGPIEAEDQIYPRSYPKPELAGCRPTP